MSCANLPITAGDRNPARVGFDANDVASDI
jgi:hypothetical protein